MLSLYLTISLKLPFDLIRFQQILSVILQEIPLFTDITSFFIQEQKMKMIFVDAENVGLKVLESLEVSMIDKVFVFSKSNSVKQCCEKSFFFYFSDYPSGQNQADFYIVAHLSRILFFLSKTEIASICFELYSNDESLISACDFQCAQISAEFRSIRSIRSIRSKNKVVVPIKQKKKSQAKTPEEKLHQILKSPMSLNLSLQKKLGLSKQDFSKAITTLTKSNKIKRSVENKKQWISV